MTHALNLGGVATYMSALSRGLIARGIRVAIATRLTNDGTQYGREYFESIGVQIAQCEFPGYSPSLRTAINAWKSARRLRQIIAEHAADVLHIQAPTLCLAARLVGTPYVTTFNIAVEGRNKIRMARLANQISETAFGSTSIAISSELAAGLVRDLHLPAERVKRLTYTIDEQQFWSASSNEKRAARRKFSLPEGGIIVCMVASLEERKNHPLLLDAAKILTQRGRPLTMLLAGSGWGDLPDRLRAAISERGLESTVHYVGQQPALPVYHASDVFVLPSTREGFPLSTVEAMLCALVPIRTPSEGARDQIRDGETGFIVPYNQPEVLADRLDRLSHDDALRSRLSQAAKAYAGEHFRADLMVEQTLAVYRAAAGEGR